VLGLVGSVDAQQVDVWSRPVQTVHVREFDALHYRIQINLDHQAGAFDAITTVTLLPFNDGLTDVELDIEKLVVSRVEDPRGTELKFEQPPHKLLIHLGTPHRNRDTIRLSISYRGEHLIDSTGSSRGINFVHRSASRPDQIITHSFPTGARHWFPCQDQPDDKATQEVVATVRADFKLLSNGRLLSVTENPQRKTVTYHWSQEEPHSTYLSTIVAGPFEIIRDSLDSLPMNYWVHKDDKRYVASTFPRSPEIVRLFEREYGYKFPWAKYDQAALFGIGGGAECTSASMLGQGSLHDQRAEQDFSSYSWLICHEAAHQWWGDLITCRDWTHTWLNESFGSYSEVMYALYDKGESDAELNVQGKRNQYLQEAKTRYARPIVFDRWNEPGDNFDRHTYQKGASLIHQIRWMLGEKPFHILLSYFLHKHAFRPADTHDFMVSVQEATGQNLDWFFEDWFFKPGHPVFDVEYSWDATKGVTTIRVAQTQDSAHGVPVFRTPVLLAVQTAAGKQTKRVWLSKREESFGIPCAEKPLLVKFDDGDHLLKEMHFPKSTEELIYQAKHDDILGKLWAISELSSRLKDSHVVEALTAAAVDPFWAVRRDALYRLACFRGVIQMDLDRNLIPQSRLDSVAANPSVDRHSMIALFKKMALDPHSQVRSAALFGLGTYAAKEELSFLKLRYERDDSYLAQSFALRALGKCGDQSVVAFLKKVADMDSPRNVIRSAANWALGRLIKK
jgi:aminopeptidase N